MKTKFYEFFKNFFNSQNISKIFIIFTLGFTSRYMIFYYFDINVFIDFMHPISIGYYACLYTFIVFINELFSHFNFSIRPSIIWDYFTNFKFEYLKPSYISKLFRDYFDTQATTHKIPSLTHEVNEDVSPAHDEL